MMALKGVAKLGCVVPQLGWGDLGFKSSGFVCYRVRDEEGFRKWELYDGFLGLSTQRAIRAVADENSSSSAAELQRMVDQTEGNGSRRLQKDSTSLPRPLSVTDFSVSPNDGLKTRISYKGLPGAYSEDAALKVHPHCETIPCDEFDDAFKAVELRLADKAVLPIENSFGGSIHRNYDLLLRHRLHIVGEVQWAVNLCLLALPGVRTDQLKRVLSHPLALAQSDIILSELGVIRENVNDTADAAQFVASNGLRDAGVVASARAAEIYGLNILAERIQDDSDTITRYLVLSRDPIIPRTDKTFKASIVFTLDEGPGMLFKALAVFASRDINLTKIESRPQRKRPLRVVDDSDTRSANFHGGAPCTNSFGTIAGICNISLCTRLLSHGYSSINVYLWWQYYQGYLYPCSSQCKRYLSQNLLR